MINSLPSRVPCGVLLLKAAFRLIAFCICFEGGAALLKANVPGGIISGGSNVTLTSTGTTATMSNGIVSIFIVKSSAQITTISYTFNNTGTNQTLNLLSGNPNGGKLYWEHSNNQGLDFTNSYTVVADPASNGGDYAEISLYSTTQANMPFEVHYSMHRGSPGFYVTAMWIHDSSKGAFGMGECRDNIYAGSIFNWMSVDAARNKLMQLSGTAIGVPGAPVEVSLWTSGMYQGQYEDKYCYAADFGVQRVWGWSSVGSGAKNVGLWNVSASMEYYNGGPMKRELMEHGGTTILNMINGSHFGGGTDGTVAANEPWTKVCGPYFIYCNNIPVTSTNTNMTTASSLLYADAQAQAAAEQTAWPYSWFNNPNYASAANRGTVTGQIVINDPYNPNASEGNLWVGLVRQPLTSGTAYDFQQWMKPYQFWVKSDGSGNFTIPAVISGTNYTLYAFGPGAAGTFQSQSQTGGNSPNTEDIPILPFSVAVIGSATNNLGTVTWTPTRVGPTVFEIGYPNRTSDKFRHGDDYWVGDIGPSPTSPSPIWSKHLEFPFDFPSGLNYVVGQSRWTTDWNYVQSALPNSTGDFSGSTSTITFNLPAVSGTQASFYIALSSDYQGPLKIAVNGTQIAGANGYFPNYNSSSNGSDATIRQGIHGLFSDNRITFSSSLLHAGQNTITVEMRKGDDANSPGSAWMNHAMYDYIRLELTGYVPPAPGSVAAYPGNNSVLLSWPVTPGATSYDILRSITSGTNYLPIASGTNGAKGPVCGSGPTNATYLDTTATNGTTYYYAVRSVNTTGTSVSSPQSSGVAPSSGAPSTAPAAPIGVTATGTNRSVTVTWNASAGANYYTVQRSTLVSNGGGSYNTLGTIVLSNTVTGTTYIDNSPTNGSTYSYAVLASNAIGTGTASTAVNAVPLSPAPTAAPASLTASPGPAGRQVTLSWPAVSGATGYIVQVSTTSGTNYTLAASVSTLTYTDDVAGDNTTYYYVVAATTSGGTGANSPEASATTAPAPPAGLTSSPGNTQVSLSWNPSATAASYVILRSTVSGKSYSVVGNSNGTTFTDNGLTNGTTYYYVVEASNANGAGVNSSQVAATPVATVPVAPASLTATAGFQQVALNWTASVGATSYTLMSGTNSGGPYSTTVASGITATTSTNTGLTYGTTYYYVVQATGTGGTGAYSNEAGATPFGGPQTLIWTGSNSTAWDATTLNWLNGSAASAYIDGSFLTFSDTAAITTVSIESTVSPGSVTFVNSSTNYAVSGTAAGISGTTSLIKSGSGALTISSSNSFTGGVVLNSGSLILANTYALGSGTTTLNGGVLDTSTLRPPNPINVTAPSTISGGAGNGSQGIGIVSGSTTLTCYATSVFDLEGDLSGFTGQILLTGSGSFRLFGSSGSATASIDLGDRSLNARSGTAFTLGSLSGSAGGVLSGASGGGNIVAVTYTIGANDTNSTFAGVIKNGNSTTAITKTGAGTLLLTSATSSYSGVTIVNEGMLAVAVLANGGALSSTGTSSNASSNLVLDGGALSYIGGVGSTDRRFTVGTNGGGLDASGSGAIVLSNTSAVTLSGTNTARTITLSGNNTGNNTLAAAIGNNGSGATSLLKTGPGVWVLSSNQTYTGATTIAGGMLKLSGSLNSSGNVTVLTNGTLDLGGTASIGALQINSGGTLISGGRINGNFANYGTVALTSGTLILNGTSLTNYGTMRLIGGAVLSTSGTFVNNGLLDVMTAGSFPPNFVNNGTVLDSSTVKVQQASIAGTNFNLTIQSYLQHTYQLQRADSLTAPAWTTIDSKQGTGSLLNFTDTGGVTGTQRFYRVRVSP